MKTWLRAATATAAVLITASTAVFAQYDNDRQARFGLRLSTYRPSASALTDISGVWYAPTVDYHIKFDEADRPSLVASVSQFGKDDGPVRAKLTPLTVSYLKHYAKDKNSNGWYAGGGLGFYSYSFQTYNGWTGTQKSSDTSLGFNLVGGYEMGEAFFVELRYDKVGSLTHGAANEKISFDGLTLSLGTRVAY